MCGIVGYIGNKDCGHILIDGLRKLEYRGYDSAGVAIFDGDDVRIVRAEGKLTELERRYLDDPIAGRTGIGHTRWATHGRPSETNAHPHRADDIIVVHNGIVENHLELRASLQSKGRTFESETDTEIFAHLIALERPKHDSLHAAVRSALEVVRGSYALVVLDASEPDQLIAARNQSPLVLGIGDDEYFAASDIPAILSHTRDVIFLEDGDTVVLTRDGVTIHDDHGAVIERESQRIQWDPVSAEKQGYKHFMLKEIHEQPSKIVDTIRGRITMEPQRVTLDELNLSADDIAKVDRILVLACGTSFHAGLVGKYAIEQLARIPVEVDLASEFRYRDPIVDESTLVIAISQSGETADTLAAVREAQRLGATAIAICNVMESSIPRVCAGTLYTHAGPEIGVASTKAFTTQLAAIYLIAIWLSQHRGTLSDDERGELLTALRSIPQQLEHVLKSEEQIVSVSRDFVHAEDFLYLGRGPQFPIALEGALKLKEISYIHAEGYAAGEMKHGPIALIDESLPIVVVAPQNRHYEKIFSNIEEVKARGGQVIVVATEPVDGLEGHADHILVVPDTHELLQPLLTIVPLQLLAYHVADMKGTDVDQPRNLAKSVTVE